MNSFGVYQTYYENHILADKSPDQISWIGSTQSLLLLVVGVIAGPLYDMGYLRGLMIVGSLLVTLGFMFASMSTQYWHFMLSQAVCIGTGAGLLVIPSLALIPQYFLNKRALATGIITAGSSVGGVIYPLIFQRLSERVGFAWATRAIGFIVLVTSTIAIVVMRPRGNPSSKRTLVDKAAFREAKYLLYCSALFFSYVGFFGPVFYLQSYALSHGMSQGTLALYLVAILNAASIPGRLLPALLIPYLGAITTMLSGAVSCAVICFSWLAVHGTAGNIIFAVMYGLTSGAFISTPAVVLASITSDMSRFGTRMGMAAVLNGVGSLVGSPVCGAILKSTGSYFGVILFCSFSIVAMAGFLVGLRWISSGGKLLTRV